MKTLLCLLSVLAGCFVGFLAFVAGFGTLMSFFTDAHPLTMRIGEHATTSQTLLGKLIGALLCCVLCWLARVFFVTLPDRVRRNRVAYPSIKPGDQRQKDFRTEKF
jgi:hypothetical protein